jgi:hypothetical protein
MRRNFGMKHGFFNSGEVVNIPAMSYWDPAA